MKIHTAVRVAITVFAAGCCVWGQSTPPAAAPPAAAPAPASGGTFSIEADIFGYKSLQADSEAIACDVGRYLSMDGESAGRPRPPDHSFADGARACDKSDPPRVFDKAVILLGSMGATTANFLVWRTNLQLMQDLMDQSSPLKPPPPPSGRPAPPDLTSSLSLAGQAITTIQGLIGLFASNQSSTGIAGTIPDQALLNDVGRQLRNLGVKVVMPDNYGPYSLGGIDPSTSPFLTKLAALLGEHSRLQTVVQQNQVIVNAAQKKQADLAQVSADRVKIAATAAAPDKQVLQDDITNLTTEINQITQQLAGIDVGLAQATVIRAQSLISAMEGFVANLTGGSLAFAPQSVAPSPSPTPAPAGGAPAPVAAAPAPAAPAPAPQATAATPPIFAALLADGLVRVMGVTPADTKMDAFANWRILWLKTMESGGSLVTTSNIIGSKVHFSGGAIAGYGLFHLSGELACSGVAFAYGGYVKAAKFAEEMKRRNIDPRDQPVFVRGGCGAE
jgi:hypothetical protein